MAYDEAVARRVRTVLTDHSGVVEKKMFGGLAFMVDGNMCCGVIDHRLMVRVGPESYVAALSNEHAREMDFTGRPIKGMVYVEPQGFDTDDQLRDWVGRGLAFVSTLPPK